MSGHEQTAKLFSQGYSCSQSVAAAFSKRFGLDETQALRVAAAFGGGMSRAGETCGAVTGGLMVIGLFAGSTDPADKAAKARTYQLGQEFMRRFQTRCGALDCRCLLGVDLSSENGPQIAREQGLYQSVCPALVSAAAEILEDLCTNP
jgi:C_GCAxxG_C_C family probable redox protein